MKKDVSMRKGTFVKGALITTIGIVVSKILGILYVIPFHKIIGEKGGALYGYAYTIYLVFMSLSSAGVPLAISKVISEYQTLGYYNVKKRAFYLGKKIAFILGVVSFLLVILFAPLLAKAVMGNVTGGNTVEDITFVIRVISSALLIVPVLSIYRGYFQGHRFFDPPSFSQVIEQIVRVCVIVFGSFLTLRVFHLDLTKSVGIAVFGATVGALVSYIYLVEKKIVNNKRFNEKPRNVNEPFVSDKAIIKKIITYSIPFVVIDIFKSLYNYVDMVSVVKSLVNVCEYSVVDAENIYSIISTWATKFNMILLSVSTGVIVSLIPNITESVVKTQNKKVNDKIVQALNILLYLMIPMCFGISFLSKNIWFVFYGNSIYGAKILGYFIYVGLFMGLFTAMVITLQTLKDFKFVLVSLITGLIIKIILNGTLVIGFKMIGIPEYYGFITASIIGYLVSFIICLVVLGYKYHIGFEKVLKNLVDILCGAILMLLVLSLIKFIIPFNSMSKIVNIFIILFYALIGVAIYLLYTSRTKTIKNVFNYNIEEIIGKIKK